MSNRLNQEKEKKLQPLRMDKAVSELENRGFEVTHDETRIDFKFNGKVVLYFPYSGWASGSSIKDGRGLNRLLRQLDKE